MKKLVNKILDISCFVIIALLVVYEFLVYTNTIYVCRVKTGSMEKGIHVGDYIIVKKQDQYKIGDVITFVYEDSYVTHRIKRFENNKIITQGDANNTEDAPVEKANVIGKYIYKSKILNYIIDYRYILVVVAIIFFGITYFTNKDDSEEQEQIMEENIETI